MKAILLIVTILLVSCATNVPTKGCGYARSQQKKLNKYHRHHRHHSK